MNANTEGPKAVEHIVICGSGLAAMLTTASLAAQLPASIKITLVKFGDTSSSDIFYGSVVPPTAYAFNLAAGVSEPKLVLDSDVAFSWGTKYTKWAQGGRTWIQGYQLPFPVLDGVMFHHYLSMVGEDQLDRYIVSAAAARKGVFAHPPQQPGQTQQPLGRAEYGYQFDPASYARLFASGDAMGRVEQVDGQLESVESGPEGIKSIRLAGGQTIEADLYVDCTGPEASLLASLGVELRGTRTLGAAMTNRPASQLGAPVREIGPESYGWRSITPLRQSSAKLTVFDPQSRGEALSAHGEEPHLISEITLGPRAEAWSGNCVGMGHASGAVEPLTPAPLMLLQRDVERLVSLIPFTGEMSVERQEFNRRFAADQDHAGLFTRALFETAGLPDGPYWQAVRAEPIDERLSRKIELFEDRGVLVEYDLEPFNAEDWTILHFGMGRKPERQDISTARAPKEKVLAYLANMKREVERTVAELPSHAAYMGQLHQYLSRNRY